MTTKIIYPKSETVFSDLLDHNTSKDLNLRILNTLSGSSLMCSIIEETTDSFLVGLPCKLVVYGEKKVVEQYIPFNFMRIPFSALLGVIPCFGDFEYSYIDWLINNGNDLFPEYITGDYLDDLKVRFAKFKDEAGVLKDNLQSIAEDGDDSKELPPMIPLPENNTRH